MVTFGIVSEGLTDQIIIRHLLAKVSGDADPIIQDLHPRIDPHHPEAEVKGSWGLVFTYLEREDIAANLEAAPSLHLIIQIDADIFAGADMPEELLIEFNKPTGERLNVPETIAAICEKLIATMGENVYAAYTDRIHFAIAVDASECWLLPFYYSNNKAGKTTGCLAALNKQLNKQEGITISSKDIEYYRTACKPILRDKRFAKNYKRNESLAIFVDGIIDLPFAEEE